MSSKINGFSKLTKSEKIDWITKTHFKNPEVARKQLESYWNSDSKLQTRHDEFIENTLTNFYLPLGVAPNFLINGSYYTLPMAIEESSVVAAAGNAAKFWSTRGGFQATVLNTIKVGQIHFLYTGEPSRLKQFFKKRKGDLLQATSNLTKNMEKRGGGITSLELIDKSEALKNYYQLHLEFKTGDAMGANFINSCLEQLAKTFEEYVQTDLFSQGEDGVEIVMSILSNYVPHCLVKASVSCPVEDLAFEESGTDGISFAKKMVTAINIAQCEPYRAVTHNKGIMNGVDAVIIATGNDFRAVEAGVHAYAARSGKYTSLSTAAIEEGLFTMELTLPLAVGTVGGLTKLHPMVKWCMELLGNPSAEKLMEIIAVGGLAQNFAAVRSLVTTGVQKGHMKMHLLNILNQFEATKNQKEAAVEHFKNKVVTVQAVGAFLEINTP